MSAKRKKIKIGFDLDGVIISKPFFMPHVLMEFLVRSHKNEILSYRYPDTRLEIIIRFLSHHPLLRRPIKKNVELIHNLYKSDKYELFVVSSRYSFLEKRTRQWFSYYNMRGLFKKIFINLKNEQPHLFKEQMIKKLGLDVFIDDDLPLLNYLKSRVEGVDLLFMEDKKTPLNNFQK